MYSLIDGGFVDISIVHFENACFQVPQHEVLSDFYKWLVSDYPVTHFNPCDWSTQFMKVISLGPSLGSHWSQ